MNVYTRFNNFCIDYLCNWDYLAATSYLEEVFAIIQSL